MNINSRGRSCLRLLLVGLTLCGTVAAALTGWTLEPAARISPERSGHDLAHHAKFLAAAELGGRGVGSDGIDSARTPNELQVRTATMNQRFNMLQRYRLLVMDIN